MSFCLRLRSYRAPPIPPSRCRRQSSRSPGASKVILDVCHAPDFTPAKLPEAILRAGGIH